MHTGYHFNPLRHEVQDITSIHHHHPSPGLLHLPKTETLSPLNTPPHPLIPTCLLLSLMLSLWGPHKWNHRVFVLL